MGRGSLAGDGVAGRVLIPRRFNGPPASANGGYACGLIARYVGGPADVSLRSPPPLDTALELERTDGRTNEERAPDVRMAWPGEEPLEHFRARIDEVDADLALLLAHRFALTRAVQAHKPVGGHEGRDPEREADIVRGMAARTPGVPESTWRTVVDAVAGEG